MASSKNFKPTLIWSTLPYSSEQFGICSSCAFWDILGSGLILKASGPPAASVDFSFLLYSISLLPKFCWHLFLAASSSPIFFVGLLNFFFFFFPFLLLSSCHLSESSRMKCTYSISPPVCSFYATIISRLAINTFCYDEWMNFDTVKSTQSGSVTCDSVQAHWNASASCCSYNISQSFRWRCWIIALSNFQGLIKVQGLTGRAWDEFHCLRGKLRCGFELREWTIPK